MPAIQAKRRSAPTSSVATPKSTLERSPFSIRRQASTGSSGSPSSRASTFAVPSGSTASVASSESPFNTSDRAVAPSGHDQTVPRKRCKLGGVVGVLRVEDFRRQASRAQDLRKTFQIILVARSSRVRVTDDDNVCGRVHHYTIALLPGLNVP